MVNDLNGAPNGNSAEKTGAGVPSTENDSLEFDAMLRPLLPAQGALFVTNYRIIFTGVPKDPYREFVFLFTEVYSTLMIEIA